MSETCEAARAPMQTAPNGASTSGDCSSDVFLRPGLSPTMRKAPSGTATDTRVEKQLQQLDNTTPSRSVTLAQP